MYTTIAVQSKCYILIEKMLNLLNCLIQQKREKKVHFDAKKYRFNKILHFLIIVVTHFV